MVTQSVATYEDVEVWRNVTQGIIVVRRMGESGRLRDYLVYPGRSVELTPKERRLMSEDMVADLDFFANGTLQPVKLIEGEADVASIQSSPNTLSDPEMVDLLKGHWKTFEKRIGDIKGEAVLRRMLEKAKEPDVAASYRCVQVIEDRLEELSPHSTKTEGVVGFIPGMDEFEEQE